MHTHVAEHVHTLPCVNMCTHVCVECVHTCVDESVYTLHSVWGPEWGYHLAPWPRKHAGGRGL